MIQEIYNFNEISPQLSTAGMPTREQFQEIAQAGFEEVIDLSLKESVNHLPDEAELVQSLGMGYHHIPVIWEAPKLEDLEKFFQTMMNHPGRKVFVHCVANYRASVFTYLYRVLLQNEEQMKAQKDLLRIWKPNGTWLSFIQQALEAYTGKSK